ncbi:hypothetical protein JHK82_050386 [Glycine max]|nr:hypothetical protein JHK82_050386 [Glycine max]
MCFSSRSCRHQLTYKKLIKSIHTDRTNREGPRFLSSLTSVNKKLKSSLCTSKVNESGDQEEVERGLEFARGGETIGMVVNPKYFFTNYSHPTFGELCPTNSLFLKISKRKPPPLVHDVEASSSSKMGSKTKREVFVLISLLWLVLCSVIDKGGFMDLDHEDVMIIVPPIFAPKDVPENLV